MVVPTHNGTFFNESLQKQDKFYPDLSYKNGLEEIIIWSTI